MTTNPLAGKMFDRSALPTSEELFDSLVAALEADDRKDNSAGTWDRDLFKIGVPVMITYLVTGDLRLGKGQIKFTDETLSLPAGAPVEHTGYDKDMNPITTRHNIGMWLMDLEPDSPLAAVPAPKLAKLKEMRSAAVLAGRVRWLQEENARLERENRYQADKITVLQTENDALATEVAALKENASVPAGGSESAAKPATATGDTGNKPGAKTAAKAGQKPA